MPGAYTPLAGKYGTIIANGVTLYLAEWSITPQAGDVDVTGFNAPTDAQGIVYALGLTSVVEASLSIKGRMDGGNNPFSVAVGLRAGTQNATLFLGWTPTFGITVSARVLGTPASQNVKDAGNFEASLKVNGIIAYPS